MQTKPKIITEFVWPAPPSAPASGFWQAHDDRLGADDSPYGTGATEQEAIDDLIAQLGDAG